jgi:hypothetical protein
MIRHILPRPFQPQPLPFHRPRPKGRGIDFAAYGLSYSWTRRHPRARTFIRHSIPAAYGQGRGLSLRSFSPRSHVAQVRSARQLQVFTRRVSLTPSIFPGLFYDFNFIRSERAVMGEHLFPNDSYMNNLKKISPSTPFQIGKSRANFKTLARPLLLYF